MKLINLVLGWFGLVAISQFEWERLQTVQEAWSACLEAALDTGYDVPDGRAIDTVPAHIRKLGGRA